MPVSDTHCMLRIHWQGPSWAGLRPGQTIVLDRPWNSCTSCFTKVLC